MEENKTIQSNPELPQEGGHDFSLPFLILILVSAVAFTHPEKFSWLWPYVEGLKELSKSLYQYLFH
ncbi:MAG TPA: hypothetical protein VJ824_16015 [Bacillota bacterium]|nr:hypothetical protein [Bacillota bacterium]